MREREDHKEYFQFTAKSLWIQSHMSHNSDNNKQMVGYIPAIEWARHHRHQNYCVTAERLTCITITGNVTKGHFELVRSNRLFVSHLLEILLPSSKHLYVYKLLTHQMYLSKMSFRTHRRYSAHEYTPHTHTLTQSSTGCFNYKQKHCKLIPKG